MRRIFVEFALVGALTGLAAAQTPSQTVDRTKAPSTPPIPSYKLPPI